MNIHRAISLGLFAAVALVAPATPVDDPAVKELIALEEKWVNAENAKDAGTLRTILDERMIIISDSGIRSREEFIAGVMKGEPDPTQTQTLTDRNFIVDGDTAVVTEVDTLHGTRDGGTREFSFRCTTTYIRRDGKWRALTEVFNKAPPAK